MTFHAFALRALLPACLCLAAPAARAQVTGPVLIGFNEYAFQYTPSPQLGLFFNSDSSRYEFRGSLGTSTFDVYPQAGYAVSRGALGVGGTPDAPLRVFGESRLGDAAAFARFTPQGDLRFEGAADYLVGNNRYAFRAAGDENYGLFFNATDFHYEFRDGSAAPALFIDANTGGLEAHGTATFLDTARFGGPLVSVAGELRFTDAIRIGRGALGATPEAIALGRDARVTTTVGGLAIGNNARAEGQHTVVMGNDAAAFTQRSVAIGYLAQAGEAGAGLTDDDDVAVGYRAIANQGSTALGPNPDALGFNSVAIGKEANALGPRSISIGSFSEATEFGSTAIGYSSEVFGVWSVGIGERVAVTGEYAVALGREANVSGNDALAFGYLANASGAGSAAIGSSAAATADSVLAIGLRARAEAARAVALGNGASATGNGSLALGPGARALADDALALGQDAQARHANALALGRDAQAHAFAAKAIGGQSSLQAWGAYGTVVGRYNTIDSNQWRLIWTPASPLPSTNRLFTVGNGHAGARSDALIVYANGDTEINGDLTVSGTVSLTDGSGTHYRLGPEGLTLDPSAELAERDARIADLEERLDALTRRLTLLESDLGACCLRADPPASGEHDRAGLGPNVPNPFTGFTSIRYHVPRSAGSAWLTVTDVTGRVITERALPAEGAGTLDLDTRGWPAGHYTATLHVDGVRVQTRGMVLQR